MARVYIYTESGPAYQGNLAFFQGGAWGGATQYFDFDEWPNESLAQDIQANLSTYSISSDGTELLKSGGAVTVNPPTSLYGIFLSIYPNGQPEATMEEIIPLLWAGTASTLQCQQLLAYIALNLHYFGNTQL